MAPQALKTPKVIPTSLKELLNLPTGTANQSKNYQALQILGLALYVEYLTDLVTDLVQHNNEIEDRLQTQENTSELFSEMLKQALTSKEYDRLYKQCLGCSGPMQ